MVIEKGNSWYFLKIKYIYYFRVFLFVFVIVVLSDWIFEWVVCGLLVWEDVYVNVWVYN